MSIVQNILHRETTGCGGTNQVQINKFLEWKTATSSYVNQGYEVPQSARTTFVIAFSPDKTRVATSHGDHTVKISDSNSGRLLQTLHGHDRTPWCVAFHPSLQSVLASGCLGGQVRLWDLKSGAQEKVVFSASSVIASLAFHPVEPVIVIGSTNRITLFSWTTHEVLREMETPRSSETVRLVRFHPLGNWLMTGIANAPTQRLLRPTRVDVRCRGEVGYSGGQPVVQTISCLKMKRNLNNRTTESRLEPGSTSSACTDLKRANNSASNAATSDAAEPSFINPGNDFETVESDEGTASNPSIASSSNTTVERIRIGGLANVSWGHQTLSDVLHDPLPGMSRSSVLGFPVSSCTDAAVQTSAADAEGIRPTAVAAGQGLKSSTSDACVSAGLESDTRHVSVGHRNEANSVSRLSASGHEAVARGDEVEFDANVGRRHVFMDQAEERSFAVPVAAAPSQTRDTGREVRHRSMPRNRQFQSEIWNITIGSNLDDEVINSSEVEVPEYMDIAVEGGASTIPVHGFISFPSDSGYTTSISSLGGHQSRAAVATATARSSHHVHTAVVIAPQDREEPEEAMRTAVNRAIAGAFAGSGEGAVANNIIPTTHRLQLWFSDESQWPDLSDGYRNVIVPHCKVHNDASVDLSNDGSLLAILVPSEKGFPDDGQVQVISLRPESYLQCLFSRRYGPNAVSLSLSPMSGYILIGLASRKLHWQITSFQLIGQILKLPDGNDSAVTDNSKVTFNLLHKCSRSHRSHVSVNCAKFHPSPGMGIVYGTNRGHIRHCRIGSKQENAIDEDLV